MSLFFISTYFTSSFRSKKKIVKNSFSGVAACGSRGVWELQCVGVAVCGSCSVRESQCGGVTVLGYGIMGEMRYMVFTKPDFIAF